MAGGTEEGFRNQFEEERRRVDAARLALVEEKARIAKQLEQQGERLQQEVSIAGQAMRRYMQAMSGESKPLDATYRPCQENQSWGRPCDATGRRNATISADPTAFWQPRSRIRRQGGKRINAKARKADSIHMGPEGTTGRRRNVKIT